MVWPVIPGISLKGWKWNGNDDIKHQGWKIHVVARPSQLAVNTIGQVCGNYPTVGYKFLNSETDYQNQTGEQRGKWNCVYPTSVLESMMIAEDLRAALQQAGANEMAANERPPYDKYACAYICTRYGPYINDKVINDKNKLKYDVWKTNGFKPPWVTDPWVHFRALTTPGDRTAMDLTAILRDGDYPDYRFG